MLLLSDKKSSRPIYISSSQPILIPNSISLSLSLSLFLSLSLHWHSCFPFHTSAVIKETDAMCWNTVIGLWQVSEKMYPSAVLFTDYKSVCNCTYPTFYQRTRTHTCIRTYTYHERKVCDYINPIPTSTTLAQASIVGRSGLAVRRYASKQKDIGSIRFGCHFSSNIVVYGHCLVTLPSQLMKH